MECYSLGITRSGGTIVSGWNDGKIRAFYPESGKLKFVISDAHSEGVTAVALAHDDDTRPPWRFEHALNVSAATSLRYTQQSRSTPEIRERTFSRIRNQTMLANCTMMLSERMLSSPPFYEGHDTVVVSLVVCSNFATA